MQSKKYWFPTQRAENSRYQSEMLRLKRLLQAGLWTVPHNLFDYAAEIMLNEGDNFFQKFAPTKQSPLFTLPDEKNDILFVVVNTPQDMQIEADKGISRLFRNYLNGFFSDVVSAMIEQIDFCYADIQEVIDNKRALKDVVNFNNNTYGGCTRNGVPDDITSSFGAGGGTSWGAGKGFLIFKVHQKLSQLPFWNADPSCESFVNPQEFLLQGDNLRAKLHVMEKAYLTDSAKGHWDLYWPDEQTPDTACYDCVTLPEDLIGRAPLEDVQANSVVGIDFGTTSTVVAVREENRRIRLLRVGLQNMQLAAAARHYENPTVLIFENYASLLEKWNAAPFRPLIRWEDARCSHQAKAEFCDAQARSGVVRSGMTDIKTWARRPSDALPLRLRDQRGLEVELHSPQADMSTDVRSHYQEAELNPIELYAFFLGLNLNNQVSFGGRIYTEYYMTFPVKFDRSTRDRILKSFQRGLERSLPASLAYDSAWMQQNAFHVQEVGSEPTAYAAAALPFMADMAPTPEGVPFGVFDFGGGTTDFSFGVYRKAKPQEVEDCGWEDVLEILDSAGDKDLGGEHLLLLLAREVIRNNSDSLLAGNAPNALGGQAKNAPIPFALPEGSHYHGSELLLDTTAIAQSNTTKLCEALRPLWEEGSLGHVATGQLELTLWNRDGQDVPGFPLIVDEEQLTAALHQRISQGVHAFFAAFRQAFKANNIAPNEFHILMAGNSCRSNLVKSAFNEQIEAIVGTEKEIIHLHEPLLPDNNNLDAPTLKTGVAIGLLKMAPGESMGVVERHSTAEESPFRFCVGRFREGKLKPILLRNAPYGEWKQLGKVLQHGQEVLGYSLSPEAIEEKISSQDCYNLRHSWGTNNAGRLVFMSACTPGSIELALGKSAENIDQSTRKLFVLKEV